MIQKLSALFEGITIDGTLPEGDVTDVTCDSRRVSAGSLFVCIAGEQTDGHLFAKDALEKGAIAVVCERDLSLKGQILVHDTHYAYAKLCANFCCNPAKTLTFIGVTGTNGKTTVTKLVKVMLTQAGKKVGLIGTIQNEIGDTIIPATKTTPDPMEYQTLLLKMKDAGCDYIVMEVSSHALEQRRLGDTFFTVGAFTNLTQDHLDYHKTMERYYRAKEKMFSACKKAIVCIDDSYGKRLAQTAPCEIVTCSALQQSADAVAEEIQMDVMGVSFLLKFGEEQEKISYCTPGLFSVHNAMTAILICRELGYSLQDAADFLRHCSPVKGRSERIETGRDFTVICDYAHSPDGLKNILESIRRYKKGRLVTVFGCGGDRDRSKRPLMGEAAAAGSDFLIVTSDNPRTEDPDTIINDIMVGIQRYSTPYQKITNRKEAIFYAIEHAQTNDVILLAGKGHEDYQVLGTRKIHFDEREIVSEALQQYATRKE